ncbi:hypothetical protein GCM10011390_51200 [Aureimonas endophytica]|uniref:Uncharacterized protein n=1 Tax=Aureimonas endophytica TaxID=2027858 RepID=A0A917A528_9HYPH|nr:hypothetical protein [Aureimonas endophytica]GGE25507.1 hypothetical protein GCM10011390_51200 [Aureimonas endophytica]
MASWLSDQMGISSDASVPFRQTPSMDTLTWDQFVKTHDAGRFVGALYEFGAWMCPWPPGTDEPEHRKAWLAGFAVGRFARQRMDPETFDPKPVDSRSSRG